MGMGKKLNSLIPPIFLWQMFSQMRARASNQLLPGILVAGGTESSRRHYFLFVLWIIPGIEIARIGEAIVVGECLRLHLHDDALFPIAGAG